MNSKKGVSPLIATVLLIAFTVALGAVVMNWGRSYVETTADQTKQNADRQVQCSQDIDLKFQDINNVPQICYGGGGATGYVRFIVKNGGSVKIDALTVNIIGSSQIQSNSSLNASSLSVGGFYRKNISYDYSEYGEIQQIILIPHVTIGGINTTCPANALERDFADMRNCSSI